MKLRLKSWMLKQKHNELQGARLNDPGELVSILPNLAVVIRLGIATRKELDR